MFNADKEDLATHQFYSAPMLEVFKVVSKSSVLKTEISDSRATVVAKSKAKGMVQTLKVWPIMCEWQQAVHVMLRQKIPEKVEESEIRPDRGTGLHVKDGLKKCHKIAGSPIALTSERALLTEKELWRRPASQRGNRHHHHHKSFPANHSTVSCLLDGATMRKFWTGARKHVSKKK